MVNLTINGKTQQFDVPDDMPLLWVIRDLAGLTGTKFGCGMAQCASFARNVLITRVPKSAARRSRCSRR